MKKEEAKSKKEKTGCNEFVSACKDFPGMIEQMKECCTGKENRIDCCEMMNRIRKEMMDRCCAPKGEGNEPNA